MIKQDENLLGQPIFENPEQPVLQNPGVPVPSNEMGNAKPVFNPSQAANMEYVYGTPLQRKASMPPREIAPFAMKDQNGDGKITRGDVIQARIEGYKE